MAVWRADPKRRGQFVAGHAGPQRWIFRLEIGRHQDEGVMVPVGVWRCARPPIGVLFHRALGPSSKPWPKGRAAQPRFYGAALSLFLYRMSNASGCSVRLKGEGQFGGKKCTGYV